MSNVEITLRRKALVENPIIVGLVTRVTKTKTLLDQIQKEYKELNKLLNHVKQVDRQTAKALKTKPIFCERPTKTLRKQPPRPLPANVILFRPLKKTAA